MTGAQVFGANVRKRRTDARLSLDKLAALSPIPMSTGRLGDIEAGRAAPTLNVLWAVAVALSRATAQPINLADLFAGDGDVALGDRFNVELSDLRAVLCGQPVPITDAETGRQLSAVTDKWRRAGIRGLPEWKRLPQWARHDLDPDVWIVVERTLTEGDIRMCRAIGIVNSDGVVDRDLGAALMARLWGKPFTEQRDELAGPGAKAQRKGQIARRLKAQLEEALGGND